MLPLIKEISRFGGNFEFSIKVIKSESRTMFLVFTNKNTPVFTHSLVIQHSKSHDNSIYIESLDSTGHFEPRELQSQFTFYLTRTLISSIKPRFISCFSHPKKEIVFGKSFGNGKKGYLTPKKCMKFWLDIMNKFEDFKVFNYSNYNGEKTIPFSNLKDLRLYEDDPKRKVLDECGDLTLQELFEVLLLRNDFCKGALIYAVKKYLCTPESAYEFDKSINKENNPIKLPKDKHKHKMLNIESYLIETDNLVDEMLYYLRKSDFSSFSSNIQSTKCFLDGFRIALEWMKTEDKEVVKRLREKEVKIQIIKARNIKN